MKNTGYINQGEIKHYLKDLRKLDVLTVEREKELAEIMLSDPTPEQIASVESEMVTGNLRFVIHVAKGYLNSGLDISDLIAEGNVGLLRALEDFDWAKGNRFISYAVHWITQSILQALGDHARTIRYPANVVQEVTRMRKQDVQDVDSSLHNLPRTTSISRPINSDGDELLVVIKNDTADHPDSMFNENRDTISEMLGVLDERERSIVSDYFGLYDEPRKLVDIGEEWNLTNERIRQIKEKSIVKLRDSIRKRRS